MRGMIRLIESCSHSFVARSSQLKSFQDRRIEYSNNFYSRAAQKAVIFFFWCTTSNHEEETIKSRSRSIENENDGIEEERDLKKRNKICSY